MPVQPATVNDTVIYLPRSFYGDKDITVRMLDGSVLDVWGTVYINGSLIVDTAVGIPIASQAEAIAGTNNTKVMTPLRVKEATTGLYLPLSGGTVTGPIILAYTPSDPLHAVSKGYVDNLVGAIDTSFNYHLEQSLWADYYTPIFWNDTDAGIQQTYIQGSPTELSIAAASEMYFHINSIRALFIDSNGTTVDKDLTVQWDLLVQGNLNVAGQTTFQDSVFFNGIAFYVGSGSNLFLDHDPESNMEAATKQYVDSFTGGGGITQAEADARYLQLTGGQMTGILALDETFLQLNETDILFKNFLGTTDYAYMGATAAAVYISSELTTTVVRLQIAGSTRLTVANTVITAAVNVAVPDEVYGASWNASVNVPTKNAVYDKIELVGTDITNAKNRTNHTGTQSADTITNGTSNKVFTTAEQTKLAGIAAGATVGPTQEQIEDYTAAMFAAGTHTNATVTYNDTTGSLSITASGGGAGNTATFSYNTTLTEPPTGNQLRLNNASQPAATRLWVSQTTVDGLDVGVGLARIITGHQVYFQDRDDSSKWVKYTVTSDGVDDGTYYDFGVVYHTGPGGIPAGQVEFQAIAPGTIGVPPGGTTGQVLNKASATDYDVAWATASGGSPPDASTTVKGIVELATSAEVTSGSDTVRAVTPSGFRAAADARYYQRTGGVLTGSVSIRLPFAFHLSLEDSAGTGYGYIGADATTVQIQTQSVDHSIILGSAGIPKLTVADALTTSANDIEVPDEAYGSGWDGDLSVPTKNALYDKIQTISGGGGAVDSVNGETGVVVLNQDEVLDGTTYKQYSDTEKTKLAGVSTGATANSSDATLLARANHTGTQAISTVTNLQTELDTKPASTTVDTVWTGTAAAYAGIGTKDSATLYFVSA